MAIRSWASPGGFAQRFRWTTRAPRGLVLVAGLLFAPGAMACERAQEYRVAAQGADLTLVRCSSEAPRALLWFADHRGFGEAERRAAQDLSAVADVWMLDWVGSQMLPTLPSSLDTLPASTLQALHSEVERIAARPVDLLASGRASRLALRAGQSASAARAVLLFPILYADHEPGGEASYFPEVLANRMNLVILQPMSSAGFHWIDRLGRVLGGLGARVQVLPIQGVRDGFFARPDASAREREEGARLGEWIRRALASLPAPRREDAP